MAHGNIEAIPAERFEHLLSKLDLAQRAAARFLGKNERTVRRMITGELFVDPATAMLLELMVKHHITPEEALRSIGINVKAAERKARKIEPLREPRFFLRKGA